MELQLPTTKMLVRRVYVQDKQEVSSEVAEEEVPMTQAQQDHYKSIIGDGLSRVSVSRDLSEMDFGSGGKVFVSVSLACDQSQAGITRAVELASGIAKWYVEQQLGEVRQQCYTLGLLKDPGQRPQY